MSVEMNFSGTYCDIDNISVKQLKEYIITSDLCEMWTGCGAGQIIIVENDEVKYDIIIGLGDDDDSFILQCYEEKTKKNWYPLSDINLVDQVKEYSDYCYAPRGCFLSPEDTWIVLKDFYLTGERSKNFRWICEDDLPPYKNMDEDFNVTKLY